MTPTLIRLQSFAPQDDTLKLKALGALAQLPYLAGRIKQHMASKSVLLSRLRDLIATDISNADSFHAQQLQVRAARVLGSISSTPFSDFTIPVTLAQHPEMMDTLIAAGSGAGRPVTRHEVVRIFYNISFSPECASILANSGGVEAVLLPVLEGQEAGPCVAMRTLWAIVAIANAVSAGPEDKEDCESGTRTASSSEATTVQGGRAEAGVGRRSGATFGRVQGKEASLVRPCPLRENEVMALVAALDASIHDGSLDGFDSELYGTFRCVCVYSVHLYVCTRVESVYLRCVHVSADSHMCTSVRQ